MAEKAAPKGSSNVDRRQWDLDKYEQRAKDRVEYGDEHVDKPAEDEGGGVRNRQEFRAAEAGSAGPAGSKRAWLKSRESSFGLEKHAGDVKVLMNPEIQKKATGWYCDVCECLLRDSASYLDHVNGKKHQRKLGYSMRIERVGVDSVRDRLAAKTEERQAAAAEAERRKGMDVGVEYNELLAKREAEAEAEKEAKRAAKRKRKEEAAEAAAAEALSDPSYDAEMNALMGFGGFGGSKKKR